MRPCQRQILSLLPLEYNLLCRIKVPSRRPRQRYTIRRTLLIVAQVMVDRRSETTADSGFRTIIESFNRSGLSSRSLASPGLARPASVQVSLGNA